MTGVLIAVALATTWIAPVAVFATPLVVLQPAVFAAPILPPARLRALLVVVVATVPVLVVLARFQQGARLEDRAPAWIVHGLLLVFVPVSVAIVAWASWHNHAALWDRAEDMRRSRARVVQATDDARRALERDLHDGAQQQLVAATLQTRYVHGLLGTPEPAVATALDDLQQLIAGALEEVRRLAHGVYPAALAERGLPEALRSVATTSHGRVTVDTGDVGRLDPGVEAGVYFTCLEAITNALKHAGADATVRCEVGESGHVLHFAVWDDGDGFDPAVTPLGGLQHMQDRIAALGGTLSVNGRPGAGTTVAGAVPLG
jgi:signal transduction histidine kinase